MGKEWAVCEWVRSGQLVGKGWIRNGQSVGKIRL